MSYFDGDGIRLHIHACIWHCDKHSLDMNKPNPIQLQRRYKY
jgi:hypothetical protein